MRDRCEHRFPGPARFSAEWAEIRNAARRGPSAAFPVGIAIFLAGALLLAGGFGGAGMDLRTPVQKRALRAGHNDGCGQRRRARRKPSGSPQDEETPPIESAVTAIIWPRLVVGEGTSDRFVLSSVPASIPHEASERDELSLRSSSSLRSGLPAAGAGLCRCGSAGSWVASVSSRFLSGHRPAKRAALR